ncbi:MAG: UPF0175 family protein [Candidatus Latescibacterota bacterium]
MQVTVDIPEGALPSLRKDMAGFVEELRLVAAVKWYEMRVISQGRAAEIAGVPRRQFIDALGRYGVSPFQSTAEEIIEEATRA